MDHRPDESFRNHTGLIAGSYMQSRVIIEPVYDNISVLKFVYNGRPYGLYYGVARICFTGPNR